MTRYVTEMGHVVENEELYRFARLLIEQSGLFDENAPGDDVPISWVGSFYRIAQQIGLTLEQSEALRRRLLGPSKRLCDADKLDIAKINEEFARLYDEKQRTGRLRSLGPNLSVVAGHGRGE